MDALWADDPAELGPFTLRGRLGSGGMGVVYLGETADGRRAAVKVVHAHLTGDRAFRDRFAREIEVARRVVGPWTAQVLEADPEGPRPWLATEYVEGPSLEDQVSRAGPLPPGAVRPLAEKLAEALAALHASGVVHRDLKPSNVLLAPDGPRLIDFGIARALDATKITHTGHVIGTPAFMSPEQAAGDEAQAPSDVFSLASVVVFAATGSGPFGHTANPVAMLLRISQQEPSTDGVPDALRPHLRECLVRDPAARPTAEELARRLRPVRPTLVEPPGDPTIIPGPAEPAPAVPRVAGWAVGRGPLPWLLAANGVLAVVVVVLVVLVNQPVPVTHAPQAAAAGAQLPAARTVAQVADIPIGQLAMDLAVTPDGGHVVVQTILGTHIVDTASRTASDPVPVGSLATAIAPDGSRAYVPGQRTIDVVDIGAARVVGELPVPEDIRDLVLSPDGATGYASVRDRPEVLTIEMATGRVVATSPVGVTDAQLGISPDGATLYLLSGRIGDQSADVVLAVDTRTMEVAATIAGWAGWAAFRPDDEVFLGGNGGYTVVRGATREAVRTVRFPNVADAAVIAVAVSPSGGLIALGDTDGGLRLVDAATQVEIAAVPLDAVPNELSFAPDGRSLYAATDARTLVVIDTDAVAR
ncbi:protein kinase domain-containing protein [Pseudonocardia zijingensis]|uniref:Protein kinase domain-containing protein n=1 Tax=Pseudonocardia zijingensis TaxID=153376 RepID=A0ABP3YWX7_9PSEU